MGAEACLQKNITKFHAKGFFMKVIFCQLALGDVVGASDVADNAALQDPRFPQGREGALMFELIELCREGESKPVTEFQEALRGHNIQQLGGRDSNQDQEKVLACRGDGRRASWR